MKDHRVQILGVALIDLKWSTIIYVEDFFSIILFSLLEVKVVLPKSDLEIRSKFTECKHRE